MSHPEGLQEFQGTPPGFTEADVSGSPFADLSGRKAMFQDLMSEIRYEGQGDELLNRGLYLDLPAWGSNLFVW